MDIKDIIGKAIDVASPLVSAFVPGGSMISTGIKAIAGVFGIKEDEVTPEKLNEILLHDNDFALKMKQAEQVFNIEAMKIETEQMKEETQRLKAQLADIQSARQREVSVKDNVNKILAYSVVGAFVALAAATLLGYAKVESALAGTLVGYISAKCEQVLSYYFGSSKGSAQKTELLSKKESIK